MKIINFKKHSKAIDILKINNQIIKIKNKNNKKV